MPEQHAFSPDAVSNYFLERAEECRRPITPMKLQKLIYFAHGWHLALHPDGRPLVNEQVQAWDYGPVFPHVYYEFKDFGNKAIDRRAAHVTFKNGRLKIIHPNINRERDTDARVTFATSVLNRIWDVYGRFSAVQLSEITHERHSPWWIVRKKAEETYGGMIPRGLNIPNSLIRRWFKRRFPTAEE